MEEAKTYERQYQDGLITKGEKYNKVTDLWQQTDDKLTDLMMAAIAKGKGRDTNSVFMMADSGARGRLSK